MLEYIEKHKKKLLYIPFAVYWLLLLTATSLPGKDLPDMGVSDKIEHFTAYFILSFLLGNVLIIQNKFKFLKSRALSASFVFVAIYAALDELHQLFIPGRSCDIRDWIADVSSALFAVIVVYFLTKNSLLRKKAN